MTPSKVSKTGRARGKVSKTRRARARRAWLASRVQPAVGTETMYGDDMLVTRTKRKPPTWTIEKVLPNGELATLLLMKGDKSTRRAFRWMLLGKEYATLHSSRRMALRTASQLEPVMDDGEETDEG